jgi:hypothetical protein
MRLKTFTVIILPVCFVMVQCSSFFHLYKPPILKSAIAISMKELTEKVKNVANSKTQISSELMNFCGMNRIYGYAIDEKRNDIILIGGRMEPSNDITLDDFAVAMKNIWLETTPPGCSIDPRPKEMETLKNLMESLNKHSDEFIQDRILSKWKKSAEFESVRVLGISKNTSFAKTMVDADYLMKKISDGTYPIRLRGFKSFNRMMLESNEKEFKKNGSLEQKDFLCRFWFYPDENKFITTTNALYLQNSSVKLLTEEEYWNGKGEMVGKGNAHPVAEKYVEKFTKNYQAISNREPIYAQLETLFRMVAIQKLLKERNVFKPNNDMIDFWVNKYQLNIVSTQDSVRAIYSYNRLYSTMGDRSLTILSPMAGGVSISTEFSDSCFISDKTGLVAELRNAAINSRPMTNSVYWYFDFPFSIRNRIFEDQVRS